ncbi:glycosyltransferase family 10 domain-containing protein [Butyrivibrio sp. MC2021]|uniref:glycosyltransferase family 10 domain-containing protein n=1 Tax=Butyrivibrio sp. MC2021 TaxID=1408306 RepID=UPI0004795934|nr:glycosyltransferase family 10 [Butyrivibrio sp. MC2021]
MKKAKIKFVDTYSKQKKYILRLLGDQIEIEESDEPDFLFYGVFGSGIEHFRNQDCVKIFMASEGVIPDFNECDYAVAEYPMQVGDRYFCKPYMSPAPTDNFELEEGKDYLNRKFCNFVYSNETNGRGALLRKEFCQKLMEYKHVDCPGKVLNNMKDAIEPRSGNWFHGKLDFIKDYKFTISFENIDTPGMVSEKIYNAFQVRSVPIYWGPEDVNKIYNPKAFINCSGLSLDEMVRKVKEVDENDELYMEMLRQNPVNENFNLYWEQDLSKFLQSIILEDKKHFDKDPLGWDAGSKSAKELLEIENTLYYKTRKTMQKAYHKISSALGKTD